MKVKYIVLCPLIYFISKIWFQKTDYEDATSFYMFCVVKSDDIEYSLEVVNYRLVISCLLDLFSGHEKTKNIE